MLRLITLFFTLSLLFALAVDAHVDTPLARRHAPAAQRMIKKRSPASTLAQGINNAAGPGFVDSGAQKNGAVNAAALPTDSSAAAATTSSQTAPSQPNPVLTPPTTQPVATTSQPSLSVTLPTTSAGLVGGIGGIGGVVGGLTSVNSSVVPTSTSSSSTSSTTSTTSSTTTPSTTSTSTTPPVTTASPSTPVVAPVSVTSVPSRDPVTITSSAAPSATSAGSTSSGSVTKLQRNTIIILIVIGASIGLAGLVWTIIRKWKFRPSSSFEDRMQPIDWQPTPGERDFTEKLHRTNSARSHGSFTSGNNHDHLTPDLPPHDFTAGPAHLAPAPVGGYADLQRGPSPQPDAYQYEIPNPGHGAYYNTNGYAGGYEPRGY